MAQAKKAKTATTKLQETEVKADTIDPSSPDADRLVMDVLLKMIVEDRNPNVAMFWGRSRCGMNDKSGRKERKSNQAPTIIIRSEEKRA